VSANSGETKARVDYDLAVIGSGPAGIQAAIQAAKLGKRVVIIEKSPNRLGGTWIHTGTIPSKTLRESLEAIHNIRHHSGSHWVDRVIDDLSTDKLYGRARMVSNQEESLIRRYLEKNQVEIRQGYGYLEDRNQIRVTAGDGSVSVIESSFILIATGSRPRRPANVAFDGWRIVDSDEILSLEHVPKRIIIYGAGVIGCEYACIFGALGVDTTIIDSRTRIMQTLDHEVAKELEKTMVDMGIKFKLGHDIRTTKVKGPVVSVEVGPESLETDVLFYAAGRLSNTDRLGLDRIGIKVNDRSAIVVNDNFQTTISNIYAAGDAIGAPALAATSAQQGRFTALHAFGCKTTEFPKVYPYGVYTIPELSSVGATEEELKQQDVDYVVGRAGYSELARGYIRGDNHGLLKLLVHAKTHRILGIHIVGQDAANLIHIGMAFMLKDGHAQDFISMIFNYPTLAEAYRIAAFNALNKIFPEGRIGNPPSESDAVAVGANTSKSSTAA